MRITDEIAHETPTGRRTGCTPFSVEPWMASLKIVLETQTSGEPCRERPLSFGCFSLFFLVHNNIPVDTQEYLNTLSANFKKTNIYLSGSEKLISGLKPGKSIQWIRSVEELEKQL